MENTINSTASISEIQKFEQMAQDWWNPTGKFKPLHELTPLRLEYIVNMAKTHFNISSLEGLTLLDIGCGGGLISEPMARLGSKVTGIDASKVNINIAKDHAIQSELDINYQHILAEDLAKKPKKFQIVLALEVIEHVENIELFVRTCCNLLKPGGLIIFSTMNRTVKSFLESIIAAEYILKWLPIGTHEWSKFVKPSEINQYADMNKMQLIEMKGLSYKILSRNWELSNDISNNFFMTYTKYI